MSDSENQLIKSSHTPKQLIGSIAAILITVVVVSLLFLMQKGPQAKLEELPPLKVVLKEVHRQDVLPTESLTGRLQPAKTANLKFEVQGRVQQRVLEPGVQVQEGDEILKLDAKDLQDQLTQAQSQFDIEQAGILRDQRMLKLAKENLQLQIAEVQRYEKLNNDSLISASQLDAARQQMLSLDSQVSELQYKVSTSKARLSLKQSERDVAKRNLARATLTAPFSGYVNEINAEVGDFVTANEIVVKIVDTNLLDLHLDVRGEVVSSLQLNQDVNVRVNSSVLPGKLIALQPDPDITTNTHAIRIRLSGKNVQSGMLANADLPLGQRADVLMVPVSAVSTNAGESFVFAYIEGSLDKIAVELSRRVGSEYIVSSGLQAGAKIVARDVAGLKDGQRVITDPN